jgi:hypothetical protein
MIILLSTRLLLLLLPLLASCEIIIDIEATGSANTSKVTASGSIADVISDEEMRSFGITENRLRDGAERHSGGRPQDVFVRSPTPWNDLYVSYKWPQVTRVFRPIRTEIIGIQSEPVIVATHYMENNSTKEGLFRAGVAQQLEDTVSNMWSQNNQLTLSQSVKYEVKMGLSSVTGESSLSYANSWGKTNTESVSKTVGSEAGVAVLLQPEQAANVSMTATRGAMTIRITYSATLTGTVACNYPKKYKGSHFWGYNINNVLNAANMQTSFTSTETIRIGFYTNARVILTNAKKKTLKKVPVQFDDVLNRSIIV